MQASKYVLLLLGLILNNYISDGSCQSLGNRSRGLSDGTHHNGLPIGQFSGESNETNPVQHTYKNYQYSPPKKMYFVNPRGIVEGHPVYNGVPPTYVYQYRDSGSKYSSLLTGLALFNLGTLATTNYYQHTPQMGDICKFATRKENGDYEETKIDCQIISSFIDNDVPQGEPTTPLPPQANNNALANATHNANNVTTFALDIKGKPMEVPDTMLCSVIRISSTSNHTMTKMVPCGLLVKYSDRSIMRSSAIRNGPAFTILAAAVAYCVAF